MASSGYGMITTKDTWLPLSAQLSVYYLHTSNTLLSVHCVRGSRVVPQAAESKLDHRPEAQTWRIHNVVVLQEMGG